MTLFYSNRAVTLAGDDSVRMCRHGIEHGRFRPSLLVCHVGIGAKHGMRCMCCIACAVEMCMWIGAKHVRCCGVMIACTHTSSSKHVRAMVRAQRADVMVFESAKVSAGVKGSPAMVIKRCRVMMVADACRCVTCVRCVNTDVENHRESLGQGIG